MMDQRCWAKAYHTFVSTTTHLRPNITHLRPAQPMYTSGLNTLNAATEKNVTNVLAG